MAVLVIGEVPGATVADDVGIVDVLRVASDPPAGMHFRGSGPCEGGLRIVTLWDSRASWDAFFHERVDPILEARGMAKPDFEYWEIESLIKP